MVDSPPGRLSAVSLQLVPAADCNCGIIQPFETIFYSRTMDSSGSPGTATFGDDSSSGSTGMFAAPAIADSPDTQQSAGSGISHDQSHSSWKEVGHAVWPRDGEKKRSSSASLSTPRRCERRHESCQKRKRAIEVAYRLKSVKDDSGEQDPQAGSGGGDVTIWLCYRSHTSRDLNFASFACLPYMSNSSWHFPSLPFASFPLQLPSFP